jgi:hypothetical protein
MSVPRRGVEGIGVSLTLGLPDSLLALLDDFIGSVVGPADDDRAVRGGGRHDECSEERNEEGEDGEAHYVCLVKKPSLVLWDFWVTASGRKRVTKSGEA